MALQVWLPLDGDLRNQGLSPVTITNSGATVNNNGKIGKCYYFGGQNQITFPSQSWMSMKPANHFSVFCWVKGTTTGWLFAEGGWELLLRPTFAKIGLSGNGQYPANYNYSFDTNTWYHLGFTWSGSTGKLKLYLNGKLVASSDVPSSANFDINNSFKMCYTGGVYLNDFRIYDHVLSVKEVTELAKGLILHYKLTKPMPNLLSKYVTPGQANPGITTTAGRTNYLGNYSIQIPATENADTYFRLFLTKQLIQNNKYTFSCYVSGLKEGTYYNFPFFAQGNTGMGVIHLDHNGLNTVTFTMNSSTQNAITDPEGKTVYIMFMDDSGRNIASGQQPFQITQMKLEEGDKVTGFIPNEYDSLYAAAGYASGIVYDCSGYQNNGVEVGTITGSSDTPRYRSSEYFDGSSCIKNIVVPFDSSVCNREMTTSCWIKKTIQDNNTERTYINYIMRLFVYTNGKFRINWNHATDNLSYNITNTWDTGIDVPYNKWTHVVFTFQEGIMKIYIDGVLRNTSDRTNNANRIRGYIGQCIGARDDSFTTSFIGNISDVRIYATALSADDIKALYNDSASIDKNGNFHAYEYVEDDSRVNINKQGVFTVPEEIMENSLKEPSIDEKNIYAKGEFYED